ADANHPLRIEDANGGEQVFLRGSFQQDPAGDRQLIGSYIGTAIRHKNERAIIQNKMVGEEIFGIWPDFAKEPPQATTTDFGTLAGKTFNWAFGMQDYWLINFFFNADPVAHGIDFAKWHASLRHTPWTRIHAEKDGL